MSISDLENPQQYLGFHMPEVTGMDNSLVPVDMLWSDRYQKEMQQVAMACTPTLHRILTHIWRDSNPQEDVDVRLTLMALCLDGDFPHVLDPSDGRCRNLFSATLSGVEIGRRYQREHVN